jgi:sterol desaturase/sphingolipid hydroxylase (fatty acid hydroxylase superfamily)
MNDEAIRLIVGAAVLLAMLVLERRWPVVPAPARRVAVQAANLGLAVLCAIALRFALPFVGVAAAFEASDRGWGLMNLAGFSPWLAGLIGLIALDLAIYAQHRAMHTIPFLWRLHRVHHTETHLDATTALRFHPLEILLSAVWRTAIILAMGIPAWAVFAFEMAVNATALFNHANLRLPTALDRAVRSVLVTPDMHRVHHSLDPAEQRRNFSFTVPWWDWIFGSYLGQSVHHATDLPVGVQGPPLPKPLLWSFVVNPFR